jgi:D-3-phosphoglycerate dehydrogenase
LLVLIADKFHSSLPDRLRALGVEVTDDKARQAEADVVLIRSKTKCTREFIDAAPSLKMIIRGGVGLDNVDCVYAEQKGIAVHNTPEASSIAVAELAMALILCAANQVVDGHNGMTAGKWLKKELNRMELFGKTLGLIGIGRIGSEVAERARAFGMRVIAFDAYVDHSDCAELVDLDTLLASADVISLHVPLTDATRGILDAERLVRCKAGVVIVNTGRAGCVDEEAMAQALESGHVRCYATDVWSSDPPPPECRLLKTRNVLMLPHIGASTNENLLRIGEIIVDKIKRQRERECL